MWHNVIGDHDPELYSLYAPPVHPDGTVHHTKADAEVCESAAFGAAKWIFQDGFGVDVDL